MKFSVGSREKPWISSTYWKRNQEHCQPGPEINTKIINRWPGKIANWVNRSPEKTWIRPICRGEKLAKSIDRSRENITNFGSWLRCCQSFQIRKFFGKWKKKLGWSFSRPKFFWTEFQHFRSESLHPVLKLIHDFAIYTNLTNTVGRMLQTFGKCHFKNGLNRSENLTDYLL